MSSGNTTGRVALSDLSDGSNRVPTANAQSAKFSKGQENAAPLSVQGKGKKRKSEAPPALNEDDIDFDAIDIPWDTPVSSCDTVRTWITKFLDSGAATKTNFAKMIGTSPKSLSGFMGESGRNGGRNYAAYSAAWEYFTKRKIAGLKMPTNKKLKTTEVSEKGAGGSGGSSGSSSKDMDLGAIHLDGEDDGTVPIYDTCDEVRRKINAYIKTTTQAQFCRDISAVLPEGMGSISAQNLTTFRHNKGSIAGAKSLAFYAAYVFFEKLRIKEKKPKTKHRQDMEDIWPAGFRRDRDHRTQFIVRAGSQLWFDKYGLSHSGRGY